MEESEDDRRIIRLDGSSWTVGSKVLQLIQDGPAWAVRVRQAGPPSPERSRTHYFADRELALAWCRRMAEQVGDEWYPPAPREPGSRA